MELIGEIYRRDGLVLNGKAIMRNAVRAIIPRGRALLMVYSRANGDYKFPGGGVNVGEVFEEALARELAEECGAHLIKVEAEFGKMIEYDRPQEREFDLFKMTSHYYVCSVAPALGAQRLDDYEEAMGFTPVWVDIDDAIATNQTVLAEGKTDQRWTRRETYVLGLVKERLMGD